MSILSVGSHPGGAGVLVLAVAGEVDMSTSPLLADALRAAIMRIPAGILVDLAAVDFLDASGVQVLITGYRLAAEHHVRYRVINPPPIVRRILQITGDLHRLTTPASPDEAAS